MRFAFNSKEWSRSLWAAGLILCAGWFSGCAHRPVAPIASGGFATVVVDAGHGGKDSGGTSGWRSPLFLREKDMTLDTAKHVRDNLKRAGLRVVMIRNDDHFVDLDQRVAIADRYYPVAVLVSIHYNATGNRGENGAQTFYWHANSHGLATRIQEHLVQATGERDHGVTRRRLRVTRNPVVPCVLCECAYLTNPAEARRVAQSGYRSQIADAISAGILEQYRKGDTGIEPVAELQAPLSRASDRIVVVRHRRAGYHHHRHRKD